LAYPIDDDATHKTRYTE